MYNVSQHILSHHSFPTLPLLSSLYPSRLTLLSRPWLKQHMSVCSAGWSIASTKLWTEQNVRVPPSSASWTLPVLRFSRFVLKSFLLLNFKDDNMSSCGQRKCYACCCKWVKLSTFDVLSFKDISSKMLFFLVFLHCYS